MMDDHGETLRKYLLGSLPADEAAELDLRIIASDELSDALARAEHELVEDHLDQSLTAEEEDLFRENFLTSPDRHQMMRETELLRDYAGRFGSTTTTVSEPAVSLIDKLRALFVRPAFAGAAVFAAVLIVGLVWQIFLRDTSTPLEREYASLNQKDLSNSAEIAGLSSFSLASNNLRDANSAARQGLDNMTERVLVRLALPIGDDSPIFKATITRASAKVFSIDGVKSYQNPNGREVRMLLPRSILEKGQYQIRLERPKGDTPMIYTVTME